MKKLLTIIAFLTSAIVVCQNNPQDEIKKLKEKLDNFDSITARSFADSIAHSAKRNYVFYKKKKYKTSNKIAYYYLKKGLTKEQSQDIKNFGCNENCFVVYFDVYYKGANEDLEIKGTKKLAFSDVSGKFLDLFPTWQREFFPSATKEDILNYKNDVIRQNNSAVVRFQREQGNYWTIRYYNYH